MKDLDGLFKHLLRDVYYAENKILDALSDMADKAESDDLLQALIAHRKETKDQLSNLKKVFESLDLKPRGIACEAVNGLLSEAEELIKECKDRDARDAALIAAAQAVGHYEIARYGTLIAWAKQLGMPEAENLLKENLDQEYAADKNLSKLAEWSLNPQAA